MWLHPLIKKHVFIEKKTQKKLKLVFPYNKKYDFVPNYY